MTKDYSQYVTHLVYSPRSNSFELSLSNDTHFAGEKAKSMIEWLWLNKGEPQAFRPIEISRVSRSNRKPRLKTFYSEDELSEKLKEVMQEVASKYDVNIEEFQFNSFMDCDSLYAHVKVAPKVCTDLNFELADVLSKDGFEHLCNFKYVGIFKI